MRALFKIMRFGIIAAVLSLPYIHAPAAFAQDRKATSTPGIARPGTAEAETAQTGQSSMPLATKSLRPAPAPLPNLQHVFDSLPPDMQEELLAETDYAVRLCKAHGIFSVYQDCDCIGVKFLDNRLMQGESKHTYTILNEVGTECVNQPAIAGYNYKNCLDRMRDYDRKYAVRIEEMCACTGKEVAKAYAYSPGNSLRYQSQLAVAAQQKCGYDGIMHDIMLDFQLREAQKKNYLP